MNIIFEPFFQTALIAIVLISVAAGIAGTIAVTRRLSYMTGSIAHASFGGIGIAYLLGFSPILGAYWFGLACAVLIWAIRNAWQEREDTLLSVIWSLGMAIGIIAIHYTAGYAGDMMSYLFGNILLIPRSELPILLGISILMLGIVSFAFPQLKASIYDEAFATTRNAPVKLMNLVMIVMMVLATIALVRLVGLILAITLLTLPAASASAWAKSLSRLMCLSVIITIGVGIAGLFVASVLNLPPSAAIILLAIIVYLLSRYTKD